MMQRGTNHIAVVISADAAADRLRGRLLHAGLEPASVTTHLRGLRRSLVLGTYNRATICITLDQPTLARYGDELHILLRDQRSFATTLTAIGITGRQPLTAEAAAVGCSVYLESIAQAVDAVCYFESVQAPLHPRCSGNWLLPQWMYELDRQRVGTANDFLPELPGNSPKKNRDSQDPDAQTRSTAAPPKGDESD